MSHDNPGNPDPASPHHLEQQRRANRDALASLGLNPYGQRTAGLLGLRDARALYDEAADTEHNTRAKEPGYADRRPEARVAGRVMLLRDNGKLLWMTLRDASGDLQIAVSQRDCDEQGFKVAKLTDLSDVVIARGRVMKTKTGEITLWCSTLEPATKSLVPPPEKHAGLTDVELRYRQRYVDLWANPETMRVFEARSRIVACIRRHLTERGYLEVETPMLQALAGGAAARPFRTHMNALSIDLFMRIAPELYLKRLLVGGMPRVFEINRNFRNEGLDKQHNPEFTMLEAYEAFGDMTTVMDLTEGIIRECAVETQAELRKLRPQAEAWRMPFGKHADKAFAEILKVDETYVTEFLRNDATDLFGQPKLAVQIILASRAPDGTLPFGPLNVDYARPFDRVKYPDLFERALGFPMADVARCRQEARDRKVMSPDSAAKLDPALVVNELFEEFAEKSIDGSRPTFITHYPAAISPLTRPNRENPVLADRADLFIGHMEIAPHYTELNDPDVQEAKFREQLGGVDADKAAEENTFRTMDHDFLRALKVGMPPAGGMGLGVDRLVMLLTNQRTIRDVMLFPMMKPE